MAKVLNTRGATITKSVGSFESYDVIRWSKDFPAFQVRLNVSNGGTLNLSKELNGRPAEIEAKGGALKLTSGNGDDRLLGSAKSDVLRGGLGDDNISGLDGNDRLQGDAGDDTLYGGDGRDSLSGGAGSDTLYGGSGDDKLYGGSGDDTFVLTVGSNGTDQFRGSTGTDTVQASDARVSRLILNDAADVEFLRFSGTGLSGTDGANDFDLSGITRYSFGSFIDLRDGDDDFIGSRVADNVFGGDGEDILRGGAGDDEINGGANNDSLSGGSGDDTFTVTSGSNGVDKFRGGSGTDTLNAVQASVSRLTLDDLASVEFLRIGFQGLSGTDRANRFDVSGITGYSSYRAIDLEDGDDEFTGSQAADLVYGSGGNDKLSGGAGDDELHGGSGNDRLSGGGGDDVFRLTVEANGVDTFRGSSGTDTVDATDARVAQLTLDKAASVEFLRIGSRGLSGTEGANGFDLRGMTGYSNYTSIDLKGGNDVFVGSQADDNVRGAEGRDTLRGGSGDDTLSGGSNTDRLTGGAGEDRFVFDAGLSAPGNVDAVTDFDYSQDSIVLDEDVFLDLPGFSILRQDGFTNGSSATTANHRVIYNDATGYLYYDKDGQGGAAQILFAKLQADLLLSSDDFTLA